MLSKLGYLWQYLQFPKQKLCDSADIYHGAYLIRFFFKMTEPFVFSKIPLIPSLQSYYQQYVPYDPT
jgi:hypothetical protein